MPPPWLRRPSFVVSLKWRRRGREKYRRIFFFAVASLLEGLQQLASTDRAKARIMQWSEHSKEGPDRFTVLLSFLSLVRWHESKPIPKYFREMTWRTWKCFIQAEHKNIALIVRIVRHTQRIGRADIATFYLVCYMKIWESTMSMRMWAPHHDVGRISISFRKFCVQSIV